MIKNYQLFKETIISNIQNSNLDIGAVYFILKDIFIDIEKLYYAQINKEYIEEQQALEAEKSDNVIAKTEEETAEESVAE